MKTSVVTAVFAAAAALHAVRAIRTGKAGEALHALMGVGMAAMVWLAHGMVWHDGVAAVLCQGLAVAFFLGAVWAAMTRAPANCLMALGMAIVFTPVE